MRPGQWICLNFIICYKVTFQLDMTASYKSIELRCKKNHLQVVCPSLKHTPWSHFRPPPVKEDRGQWLNRPGMLLICARYLRWSVLRHAWQNPISCPHPSVMDLLAALLAIPLWRSFNHSPAKGGCCTFYKIQFFLNLDPFFFFFLSNRCWHMLYP